MQQAHCANLQLPPQLPTVLGTDGTGRSEDHQPTPCEHSVIPKSSIVTSCGHVNFPVAWPSLCVGIVPFFLRGVRAQLETTALAIQAVCLEVPLKRRMYWEIALLSAAARRKRFGVLCGVSRCCAHLFMRWCSLDCAQFHCSTAMVTVHNWINAELHH